jgi:hydroxyacyl-ACP dehydratase HTD2-like protein with hotdog domain
MCDVTESMPPSSAAGLASYLAGWAPAQEDRSCVLTTDPLEALAGILAPDGVETVRDGGAVPPLWHWVFFQDLPRLPELGADGHPAAGRYYPPLPSRRRMFVGGRLRVERPLVVGLEARQRTELLRTVIKQGRSGEMLLVTLRRVISQGDGVCVVEEQDLMYRSGGPATSMNGVPDSHEIPVSSAPWQRTMGTDALTLFGFSLLTSNAHRIHYDLEYARDVEHYAGLVVHGPLLVLSMLELARRHRPGHAVKELDYRLKRPVFSGDQVRVEGTPTGLNAVDLGVATHRAEGAASATLTFY